MMVSMSNEKYQLSDYNFDLPQELIAQYPVEKRDSSKLFVLNTTECSFTHRNFSDIIEYLNTGDILVVNNARVLSARLYFRRSGGGLVEILLVRPHNEFRWLVISNRSKRLKIGEILESAVNPALKFTIIGRDNEYFIIESNMALTPQKLDEIGEMPLPPYIQRDIASMDKERYQTVYAEQSGAMAAPTAGLHFTNELLDEIRAKGIIIAPVTLYVSLGTFQPVRVDDIREHNMHSEGYFLSQETADYVNKARSEGRRVIAVGTTSLRVLESTFNGHKNIPGSGETNIFIHPPYKVKSIDAMITNFHTPESTLLMLVSAFAGYDLIMESYQEAIREKYRFFSYGDAMFIINKLQNE